MEGFHYVDIFATKGIEYLFVIMFLITLVLFWRLLMRPRQRAKALATAASPTADRGTWFRMKKDYYYHQGHTWVAPEGGGVVRIGVDDFAQKLIGPAESLETPRVGVHLEQGESGWKLKIGSRAVELLSPVEGEVLAVNEEVVRSPNLINEDPYGRGWLLKVRVPGMKRNLRNLLSGDVAHGWMEETVQRLRQQVAAEMGPVLQDGGVPVSGMAMALSPDGWEEIAADYLLTK